jgi:hypothetical protein
MFFVRKQLYISAAILAVVELVFAAVMYANR